MPRMIVNDTISSVIPSMKIDRKTRKSKEKHVLALFSAYVEPHHCCRATTGEWY